MLDVKTLTKLSPPHPTPQESLELFFLPPRVTWSRGGSTLARDHTSTSVLCMDGVKVRLGRGYSETRMCSSVKLNVVLDDTQHCVLGLVKSNN